MGPGPRFATCGRNRAPEHTCINLLASVLELAVARGRPDDVRTHLRKFCQNALCEVFADPRLRLGSSRGRTPRSITFVHFGGIFPPVRGFFSNKTFRKPDPVSRWPPPLSSFKLLQAVVAANKLLTPQRTTNFLTGHLKLCTIKFHLSSLHLWSERYTWQRSQRFFSQKKSGIVYIRKCGSLS